MNYSVKIVCDCGTTNTVKYRHKPSYWVPVVGMFKCEACESDIKFTVRKIKDQKDKVAVQLHYIKVSYALQQLRDEELLNKLNESASEQE